MKLYSFIKRLSSSNTEILVLDCIEESEITRGEAWQLEDDSVLRNQEVKHWDYEIRNGAEAVIVVWI